VCVKEGVCVRVWPEEGERERGRYQIHNSMTSINVHKLFSKRISVQVFGPISTAVLSELIEENYRSSNILYC